MDLIRVSAITKDFPGTRALNNVDFSILKGEVHALCGENGAGKSTLVNIMGGLFPPTKGKIFFEGEHIIIENPGMAQKIGIAFVHQELVLCEHLTVAENIFIGRLPKKRGLIDYKKLYKDSDEILEQFNVPFKSTEYISNLNVSQKQIVEIAKAVSLDCKLLILDEPTSSLTDSETNILFEIINDLREKAISIIYISHRMNEIFEICDRVTILRDGTFVKTSKIEDTNEDDIISSMVGRVLSNLYPDKGEEFGETILEVNNLSSENHFNNISFYLKRGEILGFAGLVGAGRTEIMRSLCGIDSKDAGEIKINGESKTFKNYRQSINEGLMYLTEDRKKDGLFLEMSIKNNISAANLFNVSKGMFIDEEKESKLADEYVKKLGIKISSILSNVSSLSGGNQQKVVISKWLSNKPKIIIMDEPTRGIDVGAKAEIHLLLRNLANEGVGVIVVSSELPELMGLCDRIAVIHEGNLSGVLDSKNFTEENIMHLASGNTGKGMVDTNEF